MSANSTILAHHFEDLAQQRESQSLGMWIFLATEALVFGALFTGYSSYRVYYASAFEAASLHLSLKIGVINTLVLLTSSLTMALSVYACQTGRRRMLITCLSLTALLGITFLGLKALEYYIDYQEKMVPVLAFNPQEWTEHGVSPKQVQLFLMFYYIMTGVHAVHLIIGISLLLVLVGLAWTGYLSRERYMGVELTGLYWHFVDVIWIFLLPLLYLIGTRQWQ